MLTITKEFHFSASHVLDRLPAWHQCARMHGHNYIVVLELSAPRDALTEAGFVRDYGELDAFKKWMDDTLDHRHLNEAMGGASPHRLRISPCGSSTSGANACLNSQPSRFRKLPRPGRPTDRKLARSPKGALRGGRIRPRSYAFTSRCGTRNNFLVLRAEVFTGDALSHVAFTGALAALGRCGRDLPGPARPREVLAVRLCRRGGGRRTTGAGTRPMSA